MKQKIIFLHVLALSAAILSISMAHAANEPVWESSLSKYASTWKRMWGSGQGNIFAVEEVNTTKTAVHHLDGSAWSAMASAGPYVVRDLAGKGPSAVYAAASIKPDGASKTKAVILKYDGSTWQEQLRSDTLSYFSAIWVSSSGSVYASGGWDIYRVDGSTLTKMEQDERLNNISYKAIWGTSDTDIFSIGGGQIRHFNGSRWWRMHQGDYTLTSLWGSSANDVYAAGYTYASGSTTRLGVILHFDGVGWSEVLRGFSKSDSNQTAESINGIHGTSVSDIYAVGEYKNQNGIWRGMVLRFNGSGWTDITPYETLRYYTAWCDLAGSVYIGSSSGIYRTNTAAVTHTVTGIVKNAWGLPLGGVPVALALGDKSYETITNDNGTFTFGVEEALGQKARLTFFMECRDPQSGRVFFRFGKAGTHTDSSSTFRFVREFVIEDESDLKHEFVVDYLRSGQTNSVKTYFCFSQQACEDLQTDPAADWEGRAYLGLVHYKMAETVRAYSDALGVVVDPVLVSLWDPNHRTAYHADTQTIIIDKKKTVHAVTDFSEEFADVWDDIQTFRLRRYYELEYHEFAHHVMNCLYGRLPPLTDRGAIKDLNHGGYSNPSTADSFTEGFAIFMAQVIQDYLGYDEAGVDNIEGPLEINDKAWEGNGLKEVKAAASIFWDLYDGIDAADGDTVDLTLDQIWTVLKDYHPDMYLIYLSLVAAYPGQKTGIDDIFINHGFFADQDSGDHQYDPGEPYRVDTEGNLSMFVDLPDPVTWDAGEIIGQATNYERPDRYYPPPTQGYFIKTDETYPFFKVSVTFPGKASLNYEHFSELEKGLVYVVVPSPGYDATVRVEGYGADAVTANPLVFTASEFHDNMVSIVDKGYFKEHAFGITGTLPELPTTGQVLLSHATGTAARDGGYDVTSELWVKAILQVPGLPVTLIWREVGSDITPSGDQVISGYFYADPAEFAYGSQYNPEIFIKIYIATNGWCNIAFNHVTVDAVTVYSAHQYAGGADQTGSVTLSNRLAEHQYNGVTIHSSSSNSGNWADSTSTTGYTLTSGLWAQAFLQPSVGPVSLIWKEVGSDNTPSGDRVVSGYFYASPADFAYGSVYNPEVFVKIYIAANGWANIAFNHVTVDSVDISSAHQYGGLADQSATATLNSRLVEHQYDGVSESTSSLSIELGETTFFGSASIDAQGSLLYVDTPDDPLNGFEIDVPPGACTGPTEYSLSHSPIVSHTGIENFNPVTPLISIENGGNYADEVITVTIPVTIEDGYHYMAFYYDGKLSVNPS